MSELIEMARIQQKLLKHPNGDNSGLSILLRHLADRIEELEADKLKSYSLIREFLPETVLVDGNERYLGGYFEWNDGDDPLMLSVVSFLDEMTD